MGKEKEKELQDQLSRHHLIRDPEARRSDIYHYRMAELILEALLDFEKRLQSLEAAVGARGG